MQESTCRAEVETAEAISRLKTLFFEKGAGSRQYLQAFNKAARALNIEGDCIPVQWTEQELKEDCRKLVNSYRQLCHRSKELYKAKNTHCAEYDLLYARSRCLYESIRILLMQPSLKPFINPFITQATTKNKLNKPS